MRRVLTRAANRCLRRWILVLGVLLIITIIGFGHKGWSQLFDLHIGPKRSKNVVERKWEAQESYRNGSTNANCAALFDGDGGETTGDSGFDNVQMLKRIVDRLNCEQTIRNLHMYGPLRNDSVVVVIQVHTRINYLIETINSLSLASGIEDVLLIFSHDYYDVRINNLVRSIGFCKTMQIFFPYSTQIYTDTFPGQSPDDCPQKITRAEAIRMNCTNAKFPDLNGVYRTATTAQVKHHWWWKVNTVFDRLAAVRHFTGPVLLIEEDHYVVKDFIHMLRLMQQTCPGSKIFSLGIHMDEIVSRTPPQIQVSNWISNLGISFNRSVWNELVQCADKFCYYDDYNWDWSLQKMTKTCPGQTFWTSTLQDSRIYHIGKCGMHHGSNCSDMSHVVKLKQNLNTLSLYPETVDVTFVPFNQMLILGFGGWGDTRDHKLCMQMVIRDSAKMQTDNHLPNL